jgi:hypothetical protein
VPGAATVREAGSAGTLVIGSLPMTADV